MEVQNIGLFAIINVPQTVSAPITLLFFIALKNGLNYFKAQRMSFHIYHFLWIFTGHSPISFVLGLAWDY